MVTLEDSVGDLCVRVNRLGICPDEVMLSALMSSKLDLICDEVKKTYFYVNYTPYECIIK